jgi:hypothetical protein
LLPHVSLFREKMHEHPRSSFNAAQSFLFKFNLWDVLNPSLGLLLLIEVGLHLYI